MKSGCISGDELSAYLDGELSPGSARRVEDHLAGCAECARELALLRRTVELVKSLGEERPPEGLVLRVVERVSAGKRRLGAAALLRIVRGRGKYAAVGAVAAIALITLGIVVPQAPGPRKARDGVAGLVTVQGAPEALPAEEGRDMAGGGRPVVPGASKSEGFAQAPDVRAMPPVPPPSPGEIATGVERKVIRNADIRLRVGDFDRAYNDLLFLAGGFGGYVQDSSLSKEGEGAGRRTATVLLRVPAAGFDQVVKRISQMGVIEQNVTTGQDVTQEYFDAQARVSNLELQERRLGEILLKAKTIDEILRVEGELARVRGDIDAYRGRIRYLDNLAQLSAVRVTIQEAPPGAEVTPAQGLWEQVQRSFMSTLRKLGKAGRWLVVEAAAATPYVVLLAAVALGIAIEYRRRAARRLGR